MDDADNAVIDPYESALQHAMLTNDVDASTNCWTTI